MQSIRELCSHLALALLVLPAAALVPAQDAAAPPPGPPHWEKMKSLVGEWVAADKDGNPTDQVVSVCRMTAGGSALIETLFPGTDHEMITLYHMDGENLVLTHYCVMGNQPHMKAVPDLEHGKIVFQCTGGTNMTEKDQHMHQGTVTWLGADRIQSEWLGVQDGKTVHTAKFDLVRRQRKS